MSCAGLGTFIGRAIRRLGMEVPPSQLGVFRTVSGAASALRRREEFQPRHAMGHHAGRHARFHGATVRVGNDDTPSSHRVSTGSRANPSGVASRASSRAARASSCPRSSLSVACD